MQHVYQHLGLLRFNEIIELSLYLQVLLYQNFKFLQKSIIFVNFLILNKIITSQ